LKWWQESLMNFDSGRSASRRVIIVEGKNDLPHGHAPRATASRRPAHLGYRSSSFGGYAQGTRSETRCASDLESVSCSGGGGGSCRRFMPVLSAVEGNPRPTLPSWRGSTVSVGSRAFARKRAIRASPSKPIQRAGVWLSTQLPSPGYVPGSGAAGLLPPRRRRNHPRSGGCSSSAQRSVRDVPLGKLGTKFSKNENFGGGGS
jgi:hypothetical protein